MDNNGSTSLASVSSSGTTDNVNKRERPEQLNLQSPKGKSKQGKNSNAVEGSLTQNAVETNMTPPSPSQPSTPATALSQSSAPSSMRKNQPKTIRLTGTSKPEIASPGTAPSQGSGQASRRPSITSLHRPETPASERISDTISYTSTSISRANSPPPSMSGLTPTRRVTKSQQKKDRQERARKAEDDASKEEESAPKAEENVVQAPIVGRKKKTKKVKERTGTTSESTPAVTRPASPEIAEPAAEEAIQPLPASAEPMKSTPENKKQAKSQPVTSIAPETNQANPASSSAEPSQGYPSQPTAADIIARMQASGELPQSTIDTLFKPITSASHRFDHNFDPEVILSSHHSALDLQQLAQLENNELVIVVIDKNNALIVFPNRRCLKGLTPEGAHRYKELYQGGHRVTPPLWSTDSTGDPLDRLMPMYESWGELPTATTPADTASSQSTSNPTALLTNRFAEPHTSAQAFAMAPPPSSGVDPSNSARSSLHNRAAAAGHDVNLHRGEQRVMEVEEAEAVLAVERKATDGVEKRLNALIRKNRRLVLGSGN